jgi:hypothetical protein
MTFSVRHFLRQIHASLLETYFCAKTDLIPRESWKLKQPKLAAQLAEFLQQSTDQVCDTILAVWSVIWEMSINIETALWTIPAPSMKGSAAHEVPLSGLALEIIKSLPRFRTTGGERPVSGFSKAKARLDAGAPGMAPWRMHDLRRTVRTGLGALPILSHVCELVIAHAQPGLHKVYDLHSYRDEKQRALDLWASRLSEIVERGATDNVVRLKAG